MKIMEMDSKKFLALSILVSVGIYCGTWIYTSYLKNIGDRYNFVGQRYVIDKLKGNVYKINYVPDLTYTP